jgi:hypothetical protein
MINRSVSHYRHCLPILLVAALVSCSAGQDDSTNSPEPREFSYAGKTVTVVIGLDASAGGTTVGRLLAKYLAENLPGQPTVIVNNMPGASGLNAHLHVLMKAPADGTTVYYGPRSSLGELLQLPGFSFKYSQFTPLGGVQLGGLVVYARTDAVPGGATSAAEIVGSKSTLRFGGMSPEHGRMIISTMGLDLLGASYAYIAGYPSSGNIRAAMISGEVNTATDAAHAYLNQVVPVLVDTGQALPLFSLPMLGPDGELVTNAFVPGVASLPDIYEELNGVAPSGIVWDSIKTLLEIDQTMQHVFLGPPDMDPAAAAVFRSGLATAMATTAFHEEARRILTYVPEFIDFERQAEILGATSAVPPDVIDAIRNHIEKNSRY